MDRQYIQFPFNYNWRDVEVHGDLVPAIREWIKALPPAKKRRVTVTRTRDHRGLRLRITVKLLVALRAAFPEFNPL